MFSKKATKIDEIFTVDLTICSKCQIDGEDFIVFCGLLRKHELYNINLSIHICFFLNLCCHSVRNQLLFKKRVRTSPLFQ